MGGIILMAFSFSNVYILYVVLRYFNLHRASPSDEQIGLDESVHKEKSYNFTDFAEKSQDKDDSKKGNSYWLLYLKSHLNMI